MSFSQSKVAWISVLIGAGYTIFPFYYDKGEIFSYRKSQCDEDKNSLAAALVNKQFNAVAKSNNESYSYTNDRREYVISYNQNHSSGFMIVYDSRTRAPRYTVELLRKEDLMAESKNKKKRPNFRPEAAIDFPQFQVHPRDYTDNGDYDRGHMVPAADFPEDAETKLQANSSEQTKSECTFTMANISPQATALNRGFWAKFESWIRNLLLNPAGLKNRKEFIEVKEMLIYTTPIFAPIFLNSKWIYIHNSIGYFPKLIPIPSHYAKVIVAKASINSTPVVFIGAFLVPNNSNVNPHAPLSDFLVRLDQLESVAGFRFLQPDTGTTVTTTIVKIGQQDLSALDLLLPESRDLARVLSPALQKEKKSTNMTSFLTSLNLQKRKAFHLCEGFDCVKPMFDKSK